MKHVFDVLKDRQVVASLAGAALGALFGAMTGIFLQYQEKRRASNDTEEAKLRSYSRTISIAELASQRALTLLYATRYLCLDISMRPGGEWQNNTLRKIDFGDLSEIEFRNSELISIWYMLKVRSDELNHAIDDFTNYYTRVKIMHLEYAMKGALVETSLVDGHYITVQGYARFVNRLTDELITKTKEAYSYVLSHADINSNVKFKIKSTKELSEFKVSKQHLESHMQSINKRFNEDILIDSVDAGSVKT